VEQSDLAPPEVSWKGDRTVSEHEKLRRATD